jgi:hypothetical protein
LYTQPFSVVVAAIDCPEAGVCVCGVWEPVDWAFTPAIETAITAAAEPIQKRVIVFSFFEIAGLCGPSTSEPLQTCVRPSAADVKIKSAAGVTLPRFSLLSGEM